MRNRVGRVDFDQFITMMRVDEDVSVKAYEFVRFYASMGMGWCVGQQCAQGYPQPPAEAWVDCQRTGRCAPDGLLRVGWALGKV